MKRTPQLLHTTRIRLHSPARTGVDLTKPLNVVESGGCAIEFLEAQQLSTLHQRYDLIASGQPENMELVAVEAAKRGIQVYANSNLLPYARPPLRLWECDCFRIHGEYRSGFIAAIVRACSRRGVSVRLLEAVTIPTHRGVSKRMLDLTIALADRYPNRLQACIAKIVSIASENRMAVQEVYIDLGEDPTSGCCAGITTPINPADMTARQFLAAA